MSQAADHPQPGSSTPPGRNVVVVVVAAVCSAWLWETVAFQIVFVVPRFERLFAEFGLRLPWMTERVIRDAWWIALVCLIVLLFGCMGQRTRRFGFVLLVLVPLALNLLIIVSLYLPYTALVEALGGNAPGF
jgi:hypothetical protein